MVEGQSGSPGTGCDQLSAGIQHVPIGFFSHQREIDHDLHAPVESDWKRGMESSRCADSRVDRLAAIPGCGKNIYVGTPERRWSARLGEARSIWSSGLSGPSGLFCFLTQRNQMHETDQTDQIDQMNKTGWRIFSAS